ncbi:mucin-2 isoform X2 [Oreochromis aureus]|uniref:mucin-2 isoform X2 n=1 Tax=Oreochromis aureus TaxID=47969 RepID=UPI001954E154|nr:mucin-2 isoform X2 [Oreochromis aureus]
MAVAYGSVTQPGLLSQQYPPPLLPKPGKDNVRLQKLLKRTAKKKASAQASQSTAPFRSSLSPVNEASPDLEHSDHSTPPRTPDTPQSIYSNQQPPRFTIRLPYQHVASPYPQRAAYGRGARMSPPTVAMPSYSYSQHVTTVSYPVYPAGVSAALGQVTQPGPPKVLLLASEVTVSAAELDKPAFSTLVETHAGLRPTAVATTPSKPRSPGPTPFTIAGGQPVIRPLTVLTPLVKPRSPRPTFKATEPSRSPKPMFDVPQIRMYTASTSFYETSRMPPVYDTAGLTAIGSTLPQSKTPVETKQATQRTTPTSDIKRGITPTAEINATIVPTLEINTATSTSEIKRATSPAETKRATPPAETKRATPTAEIKRVTPTAEIKRATPTAEIKRVTPTAEIKRATPTAEIRDKTPTYEFQTSRTAAGRPKTPAYHVNRAATPVFEISRPNPLLFAVSPVTVESEWSRAPQTVVSSSSASQSVKTTVPLEQTLNGDIHSDTMPSAKPIQPSITKSKSEPELSSRKSSTGSEEPKTSITPAVTGYQRAKTPTYEASRLMTTSPGYKRPKTPTYGTSPLSGSPIGFQRPKTPSQVSQKSKSSYRGLTPAEYAAYGGIRTYSPAFDISVSTTLTKEDDKAKREISEESKASSQEPPEPSTVKETPKDVAQYHQRDEKVAATPPVPFIVVTQASDSPGAMLTQDTSTVSGQVAEKGDTTIIQQMPKTILSTAEKQKVETLIQETKPKTPETKRPFPKGGDQDPLKAVKKLLGKEKALTAEQKSIPEKNADVSEIKEQGKPVNVTNIAPKGPKPSTAAFPLLKVSAAVADKEQDRKTESPSEVQSALEKKDSDESLPAGESLLKAMLKPKGMKSKASGWSRLKKHMVVEQEEPKFPETGSEVVVMGQDQKDIKTVQEKAGDEPSAQNENETKDTPKATQMWDAVLFQMFSSKENIMHQIELNKSEEEKKEGKKDELKEIPSFAYRLPVLLFSPKFDAKKLKEAASRPVTKISTVFEMGLIGRKGKDEEPKDFNRTARGFTAS